MPGRWVGPAGAHAWQTVGPQCSRSGLSFLPCCFWKGREQSPFLGLGGGFLLPLIFKPGSALRAISCFPDRRISEVIVWAGIVWWRWDFTAPFVFAGPLEAREPRAGVSRPPRAWPAFAKACKDAH